MNTPDPASPEVEHRHHRYIGSHIPWYVHVLWVSFWVLAICYVARWLIPDLRREFQPAAPATEAHKP